MRIDQLDFFSPPLLVTHLGPVIDAPRQHEFPATQAPESGPCLHGHTSITEFKEPKTFRTFLPAAGLCIHTPSTMNLYS